MKKKLKPLYALGVILLTGFLFLVIFPSFTSQAGVLGDTYLFLSRIRADLNGVTTLTGTVSVSNGSTTVTGSTTQFESELRSGDIIEIAGGFYTISSVGSNTSLTLTTEYLGSSGSGITATANNDVEMILAITPSQNFFEDDDIVIEIQFPMADNGEWCRTANDLTVTGEVSAAPDVSGEHEIGEALPAEGALSLIAECTQGDGSTTVDTITISQIGDLDSGTTYGVKVSNDAGILGTSSETGNRTVTVQLSDDNNFDGKAFDVYLLTTDVVTVTATVADAPTVTCTISPTSSSIGTLYPGGAPVTVTTSNQLSTTSTNSGYYWAVYGKGDGTDAGLYNAAAGGYLLPSGATTVDLTVANAAGFGLTVSPPAGATVATDFQAGSPGQFGGIQANPSGAKLLMYKTDSTSPPHNASITYGARADSDAPSGTYTEYITYVCGGYY